MSRKPLDYRTKVTVLSALIGVLALTAVLGWVFSPQSVVSRQAQEPLLAGYSPAEVTGLELKGGVVLKKSGAWSLTVQGQAFPVAAERVETYLKTLATLQRERLVAQEGDAATFGLDKDVQTLKVVGKDGKVIADLEVGGANDQGNKVYVRFAGQKAVWQTDRSFARTLAQDFNTWADLTLFPGKKPADLTRITFDSRIETSDKTVYTPFDLVKTTKDGKDVWENRISQASTAPMASWAELVAGFRFGAFVTPGDTQAATASLGTVTLTWSDGSTSSVKIGPPDAQNRYRATDGKRDFWINDWSLGQLLYK